MSHDTVRIAEKFRGPPKSGNGGYVSGIFAGALTGGVHDLSGGRAVEVTLRAPIPLERSLTLHRSLDSLTVKDGETLIAEVAIKMLELTVPEPASWEQALAARSNSYSLPIEFNPLFGAVRRGVHPICFCCGAELNETEGLQVYSAPVKDNAQVAAAWLPERSFADANGVVSAEIIWTALDCPGQMAWRAIGVRTGMLGRLTARIEKRVNAGERCVVTGWTLGEERKKFFAGTALFNQRGELCAYAKAIWIGRVA